MKSSITGWKDVYSFTLRQVLKNKAYLISYFILVFIALVSMPAASKILFKSTDYDAASPIKKVYINNMTSFTDINFEDIKHMTPYKHIEFDAVNGDYDSLVQKITDEEKNSVILDIIEENGTYNLHLSMSKDGPIKNTHLQMLGDVLLTLFTNTRMDYLGISYGQLQLLQTPVVSKVTMTDTAGAEIADESTNISFSEYWFIYGILFFVMMGTVLTGTQVATSIVTEKSNRIVEYLLISVKPLALMMGKVLAMMTAALIQMISMVAALFISNMVSTMYSADNNSLLSRLLPDDLFANINIINILFCLILVFLGLLFYAVLAGVTGATVSKLEELNEGLTLFTLTSLVGVYIGLGAASTLMGKGVNAFVTFAFLFPLSSPFVLPGAILVGKAGLPVIATAAVLLLIFIVLLFRFVAKIYETLILHTGNTIKLKQLFKISKNSV